MSYRDRLFLRARSGHGKTHERRFQHAATLLYVEAPVYLAAVPHGGDDDDTGVIIDGRSRGSLPSARAGRADDRSGAGNREDADRGQTVNDLSHRFTYRRVELPQRAAGTRPDIDRVGGPCPANLKIKLCLDLLPGDRFTGLVHGGVGLGGVLGVLGSARASRTDSGTIAATRSPWTVRWVITPRRASSTACSTAGLLTGRSCAGSLMPASLDTPYRLRHARHRAL